MKIAITSEGNNPQAFIDQRFGRCAWFAFYDTESKTLSFKENPNKEVSEGAGPASVAYIAQQGAAKIVSGAFGMKVKELLADMNIQMIIMEEEKTIQEIIDLLSHETMEHIIAIPVTNGVLSQHFGHCETFYFARVDETRILEQWFVVPPEHEPGLYPAWIKQQGADTVIAGGMGARACDLFAQSGIAVYTGACPQDPRSVIESFLRKTIRFSNNACEQHQHRYGSRCS